MGRLSASGARLHELRQPKPNNAAFRQSRPPRSHGSSLGPEHPQRAIPPACREGPTLGVDVIGPPPVPPARRKQEPPRRGRTRRGGGGGPRGALPASSPWNPTGRMPAQSAAGLLPRTRRCAPHARHPHRIPGDTGSPPAIRWGCRACGPSRIRRPAPRPGHIGRQAEQGGLASGPIGGTQAKAPQRCKAQRRLCGGSRTRASADCGEHAARRRPYRSPPAAALVQKAPKTALGRAAAPTQAHRAQCGTGCAAGKETSYMKSRAKP